MRGAEAIWAETRARGLEISVIGVPKTIDNDIPYVRRSFGFETAVEEGGKLLYGGKPAHDATGRTIARENDKEHPGITVGHLMDAVGIPRTAPKRSKAERMRFDPAKRQMRTLLLGRQPAPLVAEG